MKWGQDDKMKIWIDYMVTRSHERPKDVEDCQKWLILAKVAKDWQNVTKVAKRWLKWHSDWLYSTRSKIDLCSSQFHNYFMLLLPYKSIFSAEALQTIASSRFERFSSFDTKIFCTPRCFALSSLVTLSWEES